MLRKILGGIDRQSPLQAVRGPALDEALARLVIEPPHAVWAALVSCDGLLAGCFPPAPAIHRDRISAMSAALLSLGERISKELDNGELHYAFIAGAQGLSLAVVLSQNYMLALELRGNVSVDAVFDDLRQSVTPLLQRLGIGSLPI